MPTPATFGLKTPALVIFVPDQTPTPPTTGVPLSCKLVAVSQILCGAPALVAGSGFIVTLTFLVLEQLLLFVTVTV